MFCTEILLSNLPQIFRQVVWLCLAELLNYSLGLTTREKIQQ
jgi:hypothetical protein